MSAVAGFDRLRRRLLAILIRADQSVLCLSQYSPVHVGAGLGRNRPTGARATSSGPEPRRSCVRDDPPKHDLPNRTRRKDGLADQQARPSSPQFPVNSIVATESCQPESLKALFQPEPDIRSVGIAHEFRADFPITSTIRMYVIPV